MSAQARTRSSPTPQGEAPVIPQDYQQAAGSYRKAAEQGHADAQHNLGVSYFNGQGVPKDYVLAYMLFNLGATGGNARSSVNRQVLTEQMTGRQLEEAQTLTRN